MELQSDVLEAVKSCKGIIKEKVNELAEHSAEVFVSSKLGLEDYTPEKQGIKNTYIEEFTNLMYKQIC